MACLSAPGWLAYLEAKLARVADTGVDGLYYDTIFSTCFCPRCRRWAELDLPHLSLQGFAERRLTEFRPRCRHCGTPGEKQLRPPRRWHGPPARATFAHYAARPDG